MTPVDMSRAMLFGQVADAYARYRPSYPAEAVDWLLNGGRTARDVADVGAGTGQLTGRLVDRGLRVTAVEPDHAMLAVLRRDYPTVNAVRAAAHELPIDTGGLDAVLVADAWHWFQFDATVAEVRRVLRPGGWLGLVWNKVTPSERWEYELAGIDPDLKGTTGHNPPVIPFPPSETSVATFPWTWQVTPEEFVGCLATNSAVVRMGDGERRDRLGSALRLLTDVVDVDGTRTVGLHHEAFCIRWQPSG